MPAFWELYIYIFVQKGGNMKMEKANKCIACTVEQCKNHCQDEDYCKLDSIRIGTHEPNPKMVECVDCESFEKKTI